MAGFKTHITVSTLLGAGYGLGAYYLYGVPVPNCLLAAGLCSVSGMLPDVDSDSGVPLRESLAFGAAVISMMFIHRLRQWGLSAEMLVLAGAGSYLFVRFGIGEFLRHYTVHRGMFHSLPAMVIVGEIVFLLTVGQLPVRYYNGGAVMLGYLSHLVLDELYSITWSRGQVRFKKSFGTALKVFGTGWWPNLSAYGKLALLSWVIFQEPIWMQPQDDRSPAMAQQQQAPASSSWPSPTAQEPTRSLLPKLR